MASRKSNDLNHTVNPNIKVKVEPGTSLPPLLKNHKTEPGLSTGTTRLTSFRVPRDLTLGGNNKTDKPKKVYTPNLNAQRNKNKDDRGIAKNDSKQSKAKDQGRGRGRGERGRGRGKTTNNFVQSVGVFSEGIADTSRPGRRFSGIRDGNSDREAKSALERPKLNLNHKVDKAEEEEKLKQLLRDDFVEHDTDPDMDNAPIMLPMTDGGQLYKEDPKVETEVQDDTDQKDVKPTILENGEVKPEENDNVKIPFVKTLPKEKPIITIPQIVDNKTNSYILIQFPDCLPGLRTDGELNEPKPKKTEATAESENATKPPPDYCKIGSLKEGMLGKLQILKSGKTRLVLGDNNLIVDLGSRLSFRQDLIAAKLDPEGLAGELINLGPVSSNLICSPDWEAMLANL